MLRNRIIANFSEHSYLVKSCALSLCYQLSVCRRRFVPVAGVQSATSLMCAAPGATTPIIWSVSRLARRIPLVLGVGTATSVVQAMWLWLIQSHLLPLVLEIS